MPRLYPPSPRFPPDDGGAEHAVWRALADQLPDDVALFHGLRIQEAAHEHEIDLFIAWPGVGLAAIEVKGGHITHEQGAWHQGNPRTASTRSARSKPRATSTSPRREPETS